MFEAMLKIVSFHHTTIDDCNNQKFFLSLFILYFVIKRCCFNLAFYWNKKFYLKKFDYIGFYYQFECSRVFLYSMKMFY